MSLATPWPLALTLDRVVKSNPEPVFGMDPVTLLAVIAFLTVFLTAASRGVAAYRRYLMQKLGQQTVFDMREALYKKVHALGLDYHGERRTGDTITRVTSDVKEVRSLLVDSIVEIGSSVFILVGMLTVMLLLSWQLTLLALVTVPFLFLAIKLYRKSLIERMRVVRTREGAIASVIQEAITGIRAVKIFGRENDELRRFQKESHESLDASVDSSLIEAKFSILLGVVGGFGTALVLYFGARQVLAESLTLGQLTVIIGYVGLLLSPLWALSRQVNQIGKSLVSGERIVELLNADPTVKESPDAVPAPRLDGRVTFEDVYFSYGEEAGEVLRGMSFEAEPGSRVALVGGERRGKDDCDQPARPPLRPAKGPGRDRRPRHKELYPEVAAGLHNLFVPQEPMLFRATVAENISYGRAEATREDIASAARLAGADGFIREMPDGYDTLLSERGDSLSGGQRQRISIARGDAPGHPDPDPGRATVRARRRGRRRHRG